MRIDEVYIKNFKNLRNFKLDFDEKEMTTVLIGHNGTGKSNLIEAIVIIFRDLDLGNVPAFGYEIHYIIRSYDIKIFADPQTKTHTKIIVDGKKVSHSNFNNNKDKYLPNNVFAYYSGPSNRLESHFDKHQKKFYRELLNGKDIPLRPLFYARNIHSQFALLSYFSFPDDQSTIFLSEYLGISGLESVLFVLKKPRSWKSKEGDERFWNARGVVQGFLSELYRCSLAPIRNKENIDIGFRKKN